MIENSDRGITLNKTLAWTMAGGLLGAGIWMGAELAALRTTMGNLTASQDRQRAQAVDDARNFDTRLRLVENARAGDSAELVALRRDLSDFRTDMKEVAGKLDTLNSRLLQRLNGATP